MNLGDAKRKAIKYINEYSTNGNLISAAQNADYLNRMNDFAHDCQNEISDKIGINATFTIDLSVAPTRTDSIYKYYDLSPNFKTHRYVKWNTERFYDYQIEEKQFIISNAYTGTFVLYYDRYPTTIDDLTLDTYVFEIDDYSHRLIPFYLGGMVITDEQPAISDKLLNIYYDGVSRLQKRNNPYPRRVRQVVRW